MPKAATIELATLPRERQQRGVDQQLLEEIRARVGCIGDPVALCGLDALSLTARDIANLRPDIEDRLAERRVHLGRIVLPRCPRSGSLPPPLTTPRPVLRPALRSPP